MDTNTGESPGHQSQSQQLGNSPSVKEMGYWTPTGIEPTDYDDDEWRGFESFDAYLHVCHT